MPASTTLLNDGNTLPVVDGEARKALAENVKKLMDDRGWNETQLEAKSGVAQRTINNLLKPERGISPTWGTIEKIAKALDVEPWMLTIPGIPLELLKNRSLARLVTCYMQADDKGREDTLRIAEIAVRYLDPNQKQAG